jgi:hypothetical protein
MKCENCNKEKTRVSYQDARITPRQVRAWRAVHLVKGTGYQMVNGEKVVYDGSHEVCVKCDGK